jgi:hypothetical protein
MHHIKLTVNVIASLSGCYDHQKNGNFLYNASNLVFIWYLHVRVFHVGTCHTVPMRILSFLQHTVYQREAETFLFFL